MPNKRQFSDTQIGLANYKRCINLIFKKLKTREWKGGRKKRGIRDGEGRADLRLRTYLLNGVKH